MLETMQVADDAGHGGAGDRLLHGDEHHHQQQRSRDELAIANRANFGRSGLGLRRLSREDEAAFFDDVNCRGLDFTDTKR